MLSKLLATLVTIGLAAVFFVVTWPQPLGLERSLYIAQAVSLRGLAVAASAAAIVVLLLFAMVSRKLRSFWSVLAVAVLAFGLANASVLTFRGLGDGTFEAKGTTGLTVVEWNTLGGATTVAPIARLAIDNNADIVSLPETTEETAKAIAAEMLAAERPMSVHTVAFNKIAPSKSTSVLISTALGEYELDSTIGSTSTLPTLVLRPKAGKGPVIVGVHVVSPQPSEFARWKSDLLFLKRTCSGPNVIMAGDFNATLDHFEGLGTNRGSAIGNCSDAALVSKNAALGTWPATLPALLGAPIDHVLTTPNWRVTGMHVVQGLDAAGSDHRPIVVQLSPKG